MDTYSTKMSVSISEQGNLPAEYIYFGKPIIGDNMRISSVLFDRRYRIDSAEYNNTFPNLYTHSIYDKTTLTLDVYDSYLGSKISDRNKKNTVVSVIYPNELRYTYGYDFLVITAANQKIPRTVTVDDKFSYAPSQAGSEANGESYLKLHKYLCDTIGQDNWLYFADAQRNSNMPSERTQSHIIHFYIQDSEKEDIKSLNDIVVLIHESDEYAHSNSVSDYANEISTQKIYGTNLLTNSLNTTYSKTNGLLTATPGQHRMFFFGVPFGYTARDFEYVEQSELDKIMTEVYSNDLTAKMIDKELYTNEFGDHHLNIDARTFGRFQLNYVDKNTFTKVEEGD